MRRGFVLLGLGALILQACGGTPDAPPSAGAAASAPAVSAPEPAGPPVIEFKEEFPSQPVLPPKPEQQASAPPVPPIEVDDDPSQFLGLDIHELNRRLGAPQLVRRDGPAEVWQYRGQGCTMDVFLYLKGDTLDVRHVDLRGPAPSENERRACLADLIRTQLTHGASS